MLAFMITVHMLMAHMFHLSQQIHHIRGHIGGTRFRMICHVRNVLKFGVTPLRGISHDHWLPVVRMVCTGSVR